MLRYRVTINRLLAILLLIASVAVESHVHADADTHNEEIESCFACHQFHAHDITLPSFSEFFQDSETHTRVAFLSTNSTTQDLLPPARAPPAVS